MGNAALRGGAQVPQFQAPVVQISVLLRTSEDIGNDIDEKQQEADKV